jgi:uncharacterized protein (DUF983 family)
MNPSAIDATGSVTKWVKCESCGHEYEYTMTRTASGSYSGFAVTRKQADEKAAVDAAQKLQTMLQTECDVVPCPKCSALTKDMEAAKTDWLPASFGSIGLGTLIVVGVYAVGQWTGRWFFVMGLMGIGLLLLGIFVFIAGVWGSIFGDGTKKKEHKDDRAAS